MKTTNRNRPIVIVTAYVLSLSWIPGGGELWASEQITAPQRIAATAPPDLSDPTLARAYVEEQFENYYGMGELVFAMARDVAQSRGATEALATLNMAESNLQAQFAALIQSLDQIDDDEFPRIAQAVSSYGLDLRIGEMLGYLDDSTMRMSAGHDQCGSDPTTAFLVAKILAGIAEVVVGFAPTDLYVGVCAGFGVQACVGVLLVAPLKTVLGIVAIALDVVANVLEGLKEAFEDCEHEEAVDHLRIQQANWEALSIRMRIEHNLGGTGNDEIASFQLPAAFGGHLEIVSQVVDDTIINMIAAGQNVFMARANWDDAVIRMNNGDYKDAYTLFRKAYGEATK